MKRKFSTIVKRLLCKIEAGVLLLKKKKNTLGDANLDLNWLWSNSVLCAVPKSAKQKKLHNTRKKKRLMQRKSVFAHLLWLLKRM